MRTEIKTSIAADKVKAFAMDEGTTLGTLSSLGINFDERALKDMMNYAQDALPNTQTAQSVTTPIQFLQHWMPETIEVLTQARTADELLGREIAGSWEDEEIVMTIKERVGQARPYGDYADTHNADWNNGYERRTIVRFEDGLTVNRLEEARASRIRISSAEEKRASVAESLAIAMNEVAFLGYNGGNNRTYGILNDPNLANYVTVAQGASNNTTWASKTYNEIINDFKTGMNALRVQTGDNFNPQRDRVTVGIASAVFENLYAENALGSSSVFDWLKKNFPNIRLVAVPEFNGANAGSNVMYFIAERLGGKKVAGQYIQDVIRLLGVEQHVKGFSEAYSNATAGSLVGQPLGVVRYSGI